MRQDAPAPISPALFGLTAGLPALLLALGALGQVWAVWAGFAYMAVLWVVLDPLTQRARRDADDGAEFPAAEPLLYALGGGALILLPLAVWGVVAGGRLDIPARAALGLGAGLWLGQVAHPAAHELIHRSGRAAFRLGVAVYSALLFGHHASSHRLVHHAGVATAADPNSAPEGMGFWQFFSRAWGGSFVQGWRAESGRKRRVHPYLAYLALGAAALGAGYAIGGVWGVAVWLSISLHAQLQILLADYVQHYGLRRRMQGDRVEPVGPAHSWNSPHGFSSALMLNAPRHSDHHAHPARIYPALHLPDDAPLLPWPLPMACLIALYPRAWKRRMRGPLARLRDKGVIA